MPTVKELKHPYITSKKGVQGGMPVVAGTRIPVSTIVIWYKAGKEVFEIHDIYPQLKPSQVHDALSYYYDHQEEIEQDIMLIENEAQNFSDLNPNPLNLQSKICNMVYNFDSSFC